LIQEDSVKIKFFIAICACVKRKGMSDFMLDKFVKSYWSYYLELEGQLIETKRYVEFSESNRKTYSIEYLKLYQAVCSEIDVVGKEIALNINPDFEIKDNCSIKKWGFEIQQKFGSIRDVFVLFNGETELQPFKKWQYEKVLDKNKKSYLRMVGGDNGVIQWWKDYNAVKHQRIGLVANNGNFHLANQRNLLLAFSALFLIESMFIESLKIEENNELHIESSKLFEKI
jgi:hypothetical protein